MSVLSTRRIVTGVTLVVLLVVLAGMAVYGFKAATAPLPGRSASPTKKPCTAAGKQVQRFVSRGQVQVSVFNAGTQSGLAGTTLQKLEDAGFRGGNAGNAPGNARVRRAVVWTTLPNDSSARLVALSLGRGTRVQVVTGDLGPGVDVLVGNQFGSLDGKAPNRVRLTRPVETCVDVGG